MLYIFFKHGHQNSSCVLSRMLAPVLSAELASTASLVQLRLAPTINSLFNISKITQVADVEGFIFKWDGTKTIHNSRDSASLVLYCPNGLHFRPFTEQQYMAILKSFGVIKGLTHI